MGEKWQMMCLLLSLSKSDMSWSVWSFGKIKIAGPKGSRTKEYWQGKHSCWLQVSRGVKGAGTRTQTIISVKGKYLGRSKGNLWMSTWLCYWCHRQGFGLSFQQTLFKDQRLLGRDRIHLQKWGKSICANSSEPNMQTLAMGFDTGLILFQHLFQCLGWHLSSLWMTSNWARVNNTLRQWVVRNPASTKPKAKLSSWDGITPCNTPCWGLHG